MVHEVYETPVSPAGIGSISVVVSLGFSATSNLYVPTGNSEMKVEWTLLAAPICKSRFRAQTINHTYPHTASKRACPMKKVCTISTLSVYRRLWIVLLGR
jgi:hypothetical protein